MAVKIPPPEFFGAVMFRSYLKVPWHDGPLAGVIGECKAVETSEVLGFRTNVRDSNWGMVIQGRSVTMFVPGCEVLNMQSTDYPLMLDANPEIVEVP